MTLADSTTSVHGEIEDAIAGMAGDDTFVCTRVQEAWSFGTMTHEDFDLLAESPDVLSDMASDIIAILSAPGAVDRAAEGVATYFRDLEPIHDADHHDIARAALFALLGPTSNL